ncbi:MAG: HYR domain-containing protein, partial [Acidobacteriota bacterium]
AEAVGADADFEHPPVVLRAMVAGPATSLPQNVTVIVNHLASLLNVDENSAAGQAARAKRQAQAESLANYINGIQTNDPNEAIVSLGEYSAFSFNDGYADLLGTVRGVPASPDQVAVESPDLVSPDLTNVGDLSPSAQRYSGINAGNAQALDHTLISANLLSQFVGLARPRVNADFPEALRGDATTPSRLSDRDPMVAYFSFPPDVAPPVFAAYDDQTAEATGPDGAVVPFATPTASDNLDPYVEVACAPASGSLFALGNTGVTCSTHDLANNPASMSFTVTVQDTTAPVLSLPSHLTAGAASPSGKSVSFVATAADAVTSTPEVTCTPASGSTFPVGDTLVSCVATDAAGNASSDSFMVTITTTAFGHMAGMGDVLSADTRVSFMFDVRESPNYGDRGWVMLQVRDNHGRPDRYLSANVTSVALSNNAGYKPGYFSRSGVDTVVFSGLGVWNGRAGYRFEITASDRGEPGPRNDTFSLRLYSPTGELVETVSGTLRDGNVQSLR